MAVVGYFQALPKLKINDQARKELDDELSMNLMRHLGDIAKDGQRIEPLLKRAR